MATKYVCDRCGAVVEAQTDLYKVQQVQYPDGTVKKDLTGPDLCADCVLDVMDFAKKTITRK